MYAEDSSIITEQAQAKYRAASHSSSNSDLETSHTSRASLWQHLHRDGANYSTRSREPLALVEAKLSTSKLSLERDFNDEPRSS